MPASRAIFATRIMFSASCRQAEIQKLPMPCLARVRAQSSTIESGVTFMPTIPLVRAPARSVAVGKAARIASRPFHGVSSRKRNITSKIDDAVAGGVDQRRDREDLPGPHAHAPVALLAVAEALVDDLDARHQTATA